MNAGQPPSARLAQLRAEWSNALETAQTFREMLDARYAEMDARIEELRQQFNAANGELIAEATQASEHVHRAERDLRAAIVAAFAETGQAQPEIVVMVG